MKHTITVRLTDELENWLDETCRRAGIAKGQFIREQLERVKNDARQKPFMRLAGLVDGPPNLSSRKGYSRK